MGLKPGQTNNPAGRPKGKPNKTTALLRKKVDVFLKRNWKQIEEDFQSLKPRERVFIFEKLLQYSLPKQTNVNITGELARMLNNLDEVTLTQIAEEILRIQNENK